MIRDELLPDGTWRRTIYGPDGDVLSQAPIPTPTEVDDPEPDLDTPDPLTILSALPPAQAEALVRLGVGLAQDAGALWDALEQIAPTNTARPSIDIITHHALEAGLALTDQGDPEP